MRIVLIAILLLGGCSDTVPVTNTVSKRQDYVMPEELTLTIRKVPPHHVMPRCFGESELGCVYQVGPNEYLAIVQAGEFEQWYAEHEAEHVIWGPEHE